MKASRFKNLSKRFGWRGWVLALLLAALMAGCTRQVLVTTYYLLDYRPATTNAALLQGKPLPHRVQVLNFKIPRSFDSLRIIGRFSSHQINYYHYSLWAVRPQQAAADLLTQHINSYNLFQECAREFLNAQPDFEITGEIQQIEKYESEAYIAAHLKMSFELYDRATNLRVVMHEFDREVPLPDNNMTIFAKALSDILNQEAEVFLVKVVEYFNPPAPADSVKVKP